MNYTNEMSLQELISVTYNAAIIHGMYIMINWVCRVEPRSVVDAKSIAWLSRNIDDRESLIRYITHILIFRVLGHIYDSSDCLFRPVFVDVE